MHFCGGRRHAYLIIAHDEPEIFHVLISLLDDYRNDIFVHVDQKSDISLFNSVRTKKSTISFTRKRINCFWGSPSLMETEFILFEEALAHGPYHYYHLISGVDLPLKTQDYIHEKLDYQSYDFEYVGCVNNLDPKTSPVMKRVKYWYFHLANLRSSNKFLNIFYNFRRHIEIIVQMIFRVNRKASLYNWLWSKLDFNNSIFCRVFSFKKG